MPLLDLIRIATPCTVAWSSMTGDDRRRHCSQCDKPVYDLSQLTRAEAEALLADQLAAPDGLCARYFQRTDGTIVLADCLVRRRRRRIATAGVVAAAALVGGAALAMHARGPEPETLDQLELEDEPEEVNIPIRDGETTGDVDRQRAIDELRERLNGGQFKTLGEFLGGAISLDHGLEGIEWDVAPPESEESEER